MLHDWPELIKLISGHMRTLRGGAPETMKAFSAMAVSASAGGALDANEAEPGPFYIQGDHTGGLKFRNITISLPKK